MKIIWSPQARSDLRGAVLYVARDNPRAAGGLRDRIKEAIGKLATHSQMGRPGRVPGTREWVISGTAYIVPYQVRNECVEILRVYHESRQWPESFH